MSKKIGLIQCPAECYTVVIAKSVKNYNKDEQFLYLDGQFVSFSRTKFFGLTLTIRLCASSQSSDSKITKN